MKEAEIIKGKTNSLICILLCFIIILITNVIVTKLFNSIPEEDPTGLIATVWTYSVLLHFFIFIFSIIFFTKMAGSNINVTNKMVYGKTIWQRFNVSYKEIVNVQLEHLKGISIKTNNKNYKIYFLKNNEDIYNKLFEKIKY